MNSINFSSTKCTLPTIQKIDSNTEFIVENTFVGKCYEQGTEERILQNTANQLRTLFDFKTSLQHRTKAKM